MSRSVLPFQTFPAPHFGFSKRSRQHPDLEKGQSGGAPIYPIHESNQGKHRLKMRLKEDVFSNASVGRPEWLVRDT